MIAYCRGRTPTKLIKPPTTKLPLRLGVLRVAFCADLKKPEDVVGGAFALHFSINHYHLPLSATAAAAASSLSNP